MEGFEHEGKIIDRVTIIDTPGLVDVQGREDKFLAEMWQFVKLIPRIDLVILAVKKDAFDLSLQNMVHTYIN